MHFLIPNNRKMLPSSAIPMSSPDAQKTAFYARLAAKNVLVKQAFEDMLALLTFGFVDKATGQMVDITHTLREIVILCTLLGCPEQYKHLDLLTKEVGLLT